MPITPLTTFTEDFTTEPDDLNSKYSTTALIKALFNSRSTEVNAKLTDVINILKGVASGDSGAHNIGSQSIVGVTGATVYDQLVSLKAIADGLVLGAIPAGSVGITQLNFDPATQVELDTHKGDYVRQPGYASTTGSANAYLASTTPAPTSYVDGMSIYLDIHVANTGNSTLNWDGLGVRSIKDGKGAILTAGKLPLNCIVGFRYNESTSSFQLLGEGGEYGTAGADQTLTGYTIGTPSGVVGGTMPNRSGGLQSGSFMGFDATAGVLLKPPAGYYDGGTNSYVGYKDPNHVASNILTGATILGVGGTAINGAGMKNYASGLTSSGSSSVGGYYLDGTAVSRPGLTVTGLSFKPMLILARYGAVEFDLFDSFGYDSYPNIARITYNFNNNIGTPTFISMKGDAGAFYVNNGSFCIPTYFANNPYNWEAFG